MVRMWLYKKYFDIDDVMHLLKHNVNQNVVLLIKYDVPFPQTFG